MAKLTDLIICDNCTKLKTLKEVHIKLVKARSKLSNQVLCKECLVEKEGAK